MYLTVISDDLTGAADSGSSFTRRGKKLTIYTDGEGKLARQEEEILSFNLSTRNISGVQARQRHFELCRKLSGMPESLFMKKIGTGFRGNDAFELDGMLSAMPEFLCFIIDNAPQLGTFTLYGNQYCEGEILTKSLYANDPILPPTDSCIPRILSKDTAIPVGQVDVDAVKGGKILERTQEEVEAGRRIIVFDAITHSDTLRIIQTLAPVYPHVFWTGSLGIAEGLGDYLYGVAPEKLLRGPRDIRCVCFCASAYEMARRQIAYSEKMGLQVINLEIDRLLDGDSSFLGTVIDQTVEKSHFGNVILVPKVEKYSYQPGTSKAILNYVRRCASEICRRAEMDRLVVIGGETAQTILHELGIHRLELGTQLEPGVAEGKICDGVLSGREFALKGGSVGSEQALEKMLCHMQTLEKEIKQ